MMKDRPTLDEKEIKELKKGGFKIGTAIVLIIIAILAFQSVIFLVPAGHGGILFSKMEGGVKQITYTEGWHIKLPIIESVSVQEIRVRKVEATADSASKDLQDVQTTIALNYHLDKSKLHTIYQNIGWEYEARIIKPAIEEAVKAITAQYTAENLIGQRPEVSAGIRNKLIERLLRSNIIVDEFSIMNFQFSAVFDQAIESKQVAEQDAQKQKRFLDKTIIEAEQREAEAVGVKKAAIEEATGQAEAIRLTADAEATKIKLIADAEAGAIEVKGIALAKNPDILKLEQIQRWDGTVPKITGGNVLPIFDVKELVSGGE